MPSRTSYSHGAPSWVDLDATHPEAAKQFYAALFGWTYDDLPTGDDTVGTYTLARRGGQLAAGLSGQPASLADKSAAPRWHTYVTVDDVDVSTKQAEAAGAQVFLAPLDVMDAGRMAVIADPTGAEVCLWRGTRHIGAEIVNEPGAVCWNELLTPDIDAARAFYGKVFGWSADTLEMGGMPYTMFTFDGNPAAGAIQLQQENVPSHWAVYFAVDDADATAGQAQGAGGEVLAEAFDTPAGRMAHLRDPHGAAFWVIRMADGTG